jgi:oxygen-dependent protoporphyrinogen oxidase
MPQYHVGHVARVARIETAISRHPGLAVAGAAYTGVGIPQVIASGQAAARRCLGSV